jgi:hypothetical protein
MESKEESDLPLAPPVAQDSFVPAPNAHIQSPLDFIGKPDILRALTDQLLEAILPYIPSEHEAFVRENSLAFLAVAVSMVVFALIGAKTTSPIHLPTAI